MKLHLEVPAAGPDLKGPTRADAGNYDHFVEGGYTATANALVSSRVEMTTPLSGTFLLEDCETIASGIRNGDWREGGMGAVGAVADGVAMAVDPLGSVLAMGLGCLIDHVRVAWQGRCG